MTLIIYLAIGFIYVLINGLIRKLNSDGDPMLPLVWWFLWPIGVLGLIVLGLSNLKEWLTTKNSQDTSVNK